MPKPAPFAPAAPDREAELHATAQGRALLVKELRKEIERDADTHARVYVRKRLLSPGVPEDAIRSLKLTHTKPDHYQVRATVVLPTSEGSTVTREVEADLRHGPLDSQWRLVDTEFLSASR